MRAFSVSLSPSSFCGLLPNKLLYMRPCQQSLLIESTQRVGFFVKSSRAEKKKGAKFFSPSQDGKKEV